MERGVAITLVIIALVLVFGVLVYILVDGEFLNNIFDDNGNYYTQEKESYSTYTTNTGSSTSSGSTTVVIDNTKSNYGSYRGNYNNMYNNYRNSNYMFDNYGNRIYNGYATDRYGRVYSLRNYDYYDGSYIEGGFRCYDYYGEYDGLMRTHCSRIHDYDDRPYYWND